MLHQVSLTPANKSTPRTPVITRFLPVRDSEFPTRSATKGQTKRTGMQLIKIGSQLLGSWRRHRVSILGQDDQDEARVKLTPPAIASEYKRHEYSFYMFAPVDEEQREAKSAVVKEYMDALWKLSSEALSKDVRSLVSVSLLARDHRGSASTTLTSACPCVFSVHAGARLCRKARHEQCRARQHLPAAFTQLVASAGCRLLITSIASRSLGRCNFRCPRRILECQQM